MMNTVKAFLTIIALSFSTLSLASEYLPEARITYAEIIEGPTFPGGPSNLLVVLSFEALACRTLSAQDFIVSMNDNVITIERVNHMDCFGPARKQTIETSTWYHGNQYRSVFVANPILLDGRF
jgi:hypothetical protein